MAIPPKPVAGQVVLLPDRHRGGRFLKRVVQNASTGSRTHVTFVGGDSRGVPGGSWLPDGARIVGGEGSPWPSSDILSYEGLTRDELRPLASEAGIPKYSSLSKAKLKKALEDNALNLFQTGQ